MQDSTMRRLRQSLAKLFRLTTILSLLILVAVPLQAAPGGGKGGGKGGGNGGGGPTPELHHQWRVQLNGPYSLVRPAVGPDGTIYAVDVYDHLFAVAPDGTVLWVQADAGSKGVDVGPDGTIYTGNENWVKAFNPDGSLKWTFTQTPRAFVFIDVAVGPDGYIYGVASSGMGVFSLADTAGGPQLRWTNPEAYTRVFVGYTELEFGPTADGLDQQLYFYANGHQRAVRLSDGTSVFTIGGGNTRPRVSPVDGTWHRPDSAFTPDNQLVWSFQFPLHTGGTEPSISSNGTHYTINSGNVLYAIDPFGNEKWHAGVGEYVRIPDVNPDDSLVILSTDGPVTNPAALKAISTSNGNEVWRMEFPADETGVNQFNDSGVSFSADGNTAYIMTSIAGGSARCYLNAVDTDPSIPSASTILRSSEITIDARSGRKGVSFTGNVTVSDQNRALISGATVNAHWTKPDGSTENQVATSSGSGVAKFSFRGPGGVYYLTVTGITKDGYVFDPNNGVLSAGQAGF